MIENLKRGLLEFFSDLQNPAVGLSLLAVVLIFVLVYVVTNGTHS